MTDGLAIHAILGKSEERRELIGTEVGLKRLAGIFRRRLISKGVILCAILSALIAAWYFGLDRFVTIDYLQGQRMYLQKLYQSQPLSLLAGFATIYILVTALSLPGAAALTLAAGAVFGLITATLVVSFASTIGATLACSASRYLFRDWVQNRFGDKLRVINEGIQKEGAFYLFSLRLVPIFPFFMINLLMGLTPIKLRTFFWISQIGMFPGTVVYVNAGTALSSVRSISDVMSPSVMISFTLLGVFPLVAKKTVPWIRTRFSSTQK